MARLLGQSGMSKTRLVQALFDERIGGQALTPPLAVYGDAGETDPEVTPLMVARQLVLTAAILEERGWRIPNVRNLYTDFGHDLLRPRLAYRLLERAPPRACEIGFAE